MDTALSDWQRVVRERNPMSESALNHMIRAWRIARSARDLEALGYPRQNILARVMEMGRFAGAKSGKAPTPEDTVKTDADRVQAVVEIMPTAVRASFEAHQLALIREESCHGWPHKARAAALGLSHSTYKRRVKQGREILAYRLPLDI